ncbi:MAG TPA: metallophosphoesterase [Terriglobales bacterium]|nr:metallophosphoesterase [Terriglobales bacterium]
MALPQLTRRKFLYTSAVTLAGASALGTDGFVESNHARVVRLEISLPRLPEAFDGLTIAQLSDFHYDRFSIVPIRKAVELVNDLKPDVIALTGDFVTAPIFEEPSSLQRAAKTASPCAEILSHLHSPMGSFAVLGNHDGAAGGPQIAAALREHQITVLRNKSVPLERGAARLWLAGIDDALRGLPDLGAAIGKIPTNEPIVLLAHEPDFADDASLSPIDLQLSGHSHGGQIWIPGIGAPWLPPMAREYPRGLYRVGDLTLYTNIGIGTIRVPIRINCPPEVTLITLRTRAR